MADLPRRRFEAIIKVSADTWDAFVRAVRYASDTAEDYGGPNNGFMAGYDSSHSIEISENPEMTHDKYFELVEKWAEENKK